MGNRLVILGAISLRHQRIELDWAHCLSLGGYDVHFIPPGPLEPGDPRGSAAGASLSPSEITFHRLQPESSGGILIAKLRLLRRLLDRDAVVVAFNPQNLGVCLPLRSRISYLHYHAHELTIHRSSWRHPFTAIERRYARCADSTSLPEEHRAAVFGACAGLESMPAIVPNFRRLDSSLSLVAAEDREPYVLIPDQACTLDGKSRTSIADAARDWGCDTLVTGTTETGVASGVSSLGWLTLREYEEVARRAMAAVTLVPLSRGWNFRWGAPYRLGDLARLGTPQVVQGIPYASRLVQAGGAVVAEAASSLYSATAACLSEVGRMSEAARRWHASEGNLDVHLSSLDFVRQCERTSSN